MSTTSTIAYRPKMGATYFYVSGENQVSITHWQEDCEDYKNFVLGNVFERQDVALENCTEMYKALKSRVDRNKPMNLIKIKKPAPHKKKKGE